MYKHRLLLTGASGFIGAHLAKHYLSKGYSVVSIEHDSNPHSTEKLLEIYDDIIWCRGTIEDLDLIRRIIADYEITDVIHLAAMPIERGGYRTTLPYFKTNVIGTANIMESVREQSSEGFKIKCLHFSSDKSYGELGTIDYTEDMKVNPLSIYSSSKACSDLVAMSYAHSFDLDISILRMCNVYGYGDPNPRVIPNTIGKCLKGISPYIFNNLDTIREYIYIDDTCIAVESMLEHMDIARHQIYNVGSGETETQTECVLEILKHFPHIKPQYRDSFDYTAKEIKYQALDSSKIKRDIGWESIIGFEEGIRNTVNEYLRHQE